MSKIQDHEIEVVHANGKRLVISKTMYEAHQDEFTPVNATAPKKKSPPPTLGKRGKAPAKNKMDPPPTLDK